ncbi:MAG: hypothetical protein GX677_03165 [Treponema sp.]|nr:hypothetical protein [Treponema sp.]
MDNDNKVNSTEVSVNQCHEEVLLFLQDEIKNLHKEDNVELYDLNTEYAKTKKNSSPLVFLILLGITLLVGGVSWGLSSWISKANENITVDWQDFNDLNLRNLLDTVSKAQTNYDSAVKNKVLITTEMETKIKQVTNQRDQDLFLIESLNLKNKKTKTERINAVNSSFNDQMKIIHDEYDLKLNEINTEIDEYKAQLAQFDSEKIESARAQEKALDSERQLQELERKKLVTEYETKLAALQKSLEDNQQNYYKELRESISQVKTEYQGEINSLDPIYKDSNADEIIASTKELEIEAYNAMQFIANNEISDEEMIAKLESMQQIYDNYQYLNSKLNTMTQKYSIPVYYNASKVLVDEMNSCATELIANLKESKENYQHEFDIKEEDYKIQLEEKNQDLANADIYYQSCIDQLMQTAKTSAILLCAESLEDISVYIAPKARYLIGDEGLNAEIKVGKTVKGRIYRNEDDTFRFEAERNKNDEIISFDLDSMVPGTVIKLLNK